MINSYIFSKKLFPKRKGLFDARLLYIREYINTVLYLKRFLRSVKPMSDEWLDTTCWNCRLFRIFMIKWCVEFSVIFF